MRGWLSPDRRNKLKGNVSNHIGFIFRKERLTEGEEQCIQNRKIYISTPLDAVDRYRCNLNNKEGENPVRSRGERGGFGPDGERSVFGRQEPRDGQQTDCEEEVEEEEHHNGDNTGRLATIRDGPSKDSHTHCLASSGEEHQLPPTEPIKAPDRDERGKEVGDTVEAGEQHRGVVG